MATRYISDSPRIHVNFLNTFVTYSTKMMCGVKLCTVGLSD